MEFFETLKEKLSAAADYTARKTTEITEVTKLHLEIKTQEGKLKALFEELGRLTYSLEKNATDNGAKIAETVKKVDARKEKIADLKILLAKAQGQSLCPACGAKMDTDARFCPVCGEKRQNESPTSDPAPAETPAETALEEKPE